MLTFTRLSMHFIIALVVGMIYFKVGQDAVYVLDNFNLLFFNIMFLMFSAFSATVTTCKLITFQSVFLYVLINICLSVLINK